MTVPVDFFKLRLAKKNIHLDFPNKQIQKEKQVKWVSQPHPFMEWLRWNGAYVYAYGCSLGGIICGLLSPILNMLSSIGLIIPRPQGGNLYPYVSEVIRSDIVKVIFFVGCSIGFIPTLIFATNYFKTMIRYSFSFENKCYRYFFSFWEVIQLLLFYYSAFSVIGVAFCDMDNYPDQHTVFSSTWVFFTNAMELIQMITMRLTVYKGSISE